jgi:hypothetical protein
VHVSALTAATRLQADNLAEITPYRWKAYIVRPNEAGQYKVLVSQVLA